MDVMPPRTRQWRWHAQEYVKTLMPSWPKHAIANQAHSSVVAEPGSPPFCCGAGSHGPGACQYEVLNSARSSWWQLDVGTFDKAGGQREGGVGAPDGHAQLSPSANRCLIGVDPQHLNTELNLAAP